ncbi:hypothetical protein VV869_21435 [Photobacterium sp. MCCC 1A19761]|uniref:tetratricopeptide repeat protein n=1 Tax=Photobacterium sp. MCCC 1A19761 TaxID=3115000 RepID=UPI00307FB530
MTDLLKNRKPVFRAILFLLSFGLFWFIYLPQAFSHDEGKQAVTGTSQEAPLLEGLFALDFPITTDSKEAQAYFNQGLVLTYGFDHADAEVSFLEAAKHDPENAMAYWGVAFVLGPNINAPMEDTDVPRAYSMAQKALSLADQASDRERALINALATRYSPEPVADRSRLDQDFATAMGQVYQRYPDDPDIAVMYAESLMDLHPWDYWTEDDQAQPWTVEIETILKKVVVNHPRHPHGHHLYIHLMENSPRPEDAIKSADLIRTLAPASGHLVHMAGHAYYAAGLYHDCSLINEKAIEVDKVLSATFDTSGLYQVGYMPHNLHFLLASYMMEGRSREAVEVAKALASGIDPSKMRQPDLGALQLYYSTPYYTLVRFGRWSRILDEPAPPADLKFPTGMWHYARGMAYTRKGKVDMAEAELMQLKAIAVAPELSTIKVWGLNRLSSLLAIAVEVLSGEIAAQRGEVETAIAHLKRGVDLEERLIFDEPPPWYFPVRQALGARLLDHGDAAEAEAVYRKDLLKNAENPWSLYGLTQSLKAQGKTDLAADTEKRFRRAWARADVVMPRSIF